MVKQPNNLVLRILRDTRSTQADHTRALAEHNKRFDQIERHLDEMHDGMITALGRARHAHIRHRSKAE